MRKFNKNDYDLVKSYEKDFIRAIDSRYCTGLLQEELQVVSRIYGECLNRQANLSCRECIVSITYDAYYTFCHPSWKTIETQEYRDRAEKCFSDYFKKYEYLWNEAPDQLKMQVSQGIRQRTVQEGMQMETETLSQFIERVKAL